jgi:integrase
MELALGKLTAVRVKSAQAGRHSDGQGLMLLVKPTGGRSWVLRVQVNGVRRDIGLGGVETEARPIVDDIPLEKKRVLTLAEARDKSAWLRKMAKAGRDPILEQQRDRTPIPTFRDAAKAARAAKEPDWSPRTAKAFDNTMRDYVYPAIGSVSVDQIDGQIIEAILRPIWHSKPEAAQKVRQRICMVLNFAQAKRWRAIAAPSEALSILLGDKPQGGNLPAMPFEEVPAFIAKIRSETETVGRLALQYLILTVARSGEVRAAEKKQVDADKKVWNRPAEIMKGKNAKPHSVTLNAPALEVLERADTYASADDRFIFSGKRGDMISDMTISKVMADLPYVPHGFRSSFRDWAAEKMPHIPDPVAEAALAHVVSDKVVKAYKRTAFLEMRRELLDAWGAFCMGTAN